MSLELILQMTVDEETQEEYCVYDCGRCGIEINIDDEIHVWIERMGKSQLGIAHVHCSDKCVQEAIAAHREKAQS